MFHASLPGVWVVPGYSVAPCLKAASDSHPSLSFC